MSTDSSELTFVRCPSCRSLVPAASSRCKMCGASLDASAQADQAEEDRKKSGRVRQHTMTQTPSEFSAAAGQASEPDPIADDIDDDPFDIFDMEEEENTAPAKGPVPSGDEQEGEGDDDENPLSSFLPEDEQQIAPAVVRKPPPVASVPTGRPPVTTPPPPRREEREAVRPKVSIESGGRPQGKPSNLSFSKRSEQAAAASTPPPQVQREQPQREQQVQRENPQRERQPQAVERSNQPVSKGETQKMSSSNGRLVGWFVSYEKSDGTAIELREGRFFISGSQLKPNDLVLNGKGLSTPHALVSITSSGFKIQDLMSDGGVFVKKKNAASFNKEEGNTQLDHGDWVKFGDAEFLVALISNGK